MEQLRCKLGFDAKLVVDRSGNSGGLCLLWKESVEVNLLSFSRFHIDYVVVSDMNCHWRLTGFYRDPVTTQRSHGWMLLRRLTGLSLLPWIMGGDFNEILSLSEKQGGAVR